MDTKTLLNRCIRIFYISRKPSNQEFMEVSKITSIGMVAIGVIGLIISMVLNIGM